MRARGGASGASRGGGAGLRPARGRREGRAEVATVAAGPAAGSPLARWVGHAG